MGWLERWRWHRAARAYARSLGSHFSRAYGGEPTYTPAQVDTAVHELRLDPRFIAIGYAEFIEASAYERLHSALPKPIDREIGRLLFDRYRPWGYATGDKFEPPPQRLTGGMPS